MYLGKARQVIKEAVDTLLKENISIDVDTLDEEIAENHDGYIQILSFYWDDDDYYVLFSKRGRVALMVSHDDGIEVC